MVYSQTKVTLKQYKRPAVVIDVLGGYNLPMMDLKGSSIGEIYGFKSYGVSGGFNVGTTIKATVANFDRSQFRTYLTLAYSHFTNSEDYAYGVPVNPVGWPIGFTPPTQKAGTSYIRLNIPYLAVGSEFAVFTDDALKSSFTFGIDVSLSSISGRVFDQLAGQVENFNTFHSNLRVGMGVNAQYNFRVSEAFGFNVGMRFNMLNLVGKATELTEESGYMYLNDAWNQATNAAIGGTRQIASLNFFGGVSFYIGTRK